MSGQLYQLSSTAGTIALQWVNPGQRLFRSKIMVVSIFRACRNFSFRLLVVLHVRLI